MPRRPRRTPYRRPGRALRSAWSTRCWAWAGGDRGRAVVPVPERARRPLVPAERVRGQQIDDHVVPARGVEQRRLGLLKDRYSCWTWSRTAGAPAGADADADATGLVNGIGGHRTETDRAPPDVCATDCVGPGHRLARPGGSAWRRPPTCCPLGRGRQRQLRGAPASCREAAPGLLRVRGDHHVQGLIRRRPGRESETTGHGEARPSTGVMTTPAGTTRICHPAGRWIPSGATLPAPRTRAGAGNCALPDSALS